MHLDKSMNKEIHALFVSSFVSMLNDQINKNKYSVWSEKISLAVKDIEEFKIKHNAFYNDKMNIVRTYGAKFYSKNINELDNQLNIKLKKLDKLRSSLRKADLKISAMINRHFDIDIIVESFLLENVQEQYYEDLITFVEFANHIVNELSKRLNH